MALGIAARNLPILSQAQRKAMYSAAAGHSTLGIPKKIGKEFVATDYPGKLPAYIENGKPVRSDRAKKLYTKSK